MWLLRHAEVHGDWRGIAYGNLDVPLSDEGEARTAELAVAFGAVAPALVVASPLTRARALGEALAARTGLALALEEGLAEICRGRWQGRRVEELTADPGEDVAGFYADPWGWRGHGGESDADVRARVVPVVERLLERAAGATVLVATHYNVIRVLAAAALGIPPERSFGLRIDLGRGLLLVDAPGGWRLLHSNVLAPEPGVAGGGGRQP